jgi:sigma-B regulation protein RsbU (phosphoserine phosphatase)
VLTFASAGQTPPIRIRNARADELSVKGNRLPLGVQQELEYHDAKIQLREGDVVVFITDGIVEAMNDRKEMYGFERLKKDLERWHDFPASAIRDRLIDEVHTFTGGAPQHDDMTVVIIKVGRVKERDHRTKGGTRRRG